MSNAVYTEGNLKPIVSYQYDLESGNVSNDYLVITGMVQFSTALKMQVTLMEEEGPYIAGFFLDAGFLSSTTLMTRSHHRVSSYNDAYHNIVMGKDIIVRVKILRSGLSEGAFYRY